MRAHPNPTLPYVTWELIQDPQSEGRSLKEENFITQVAEKVNKRRKGLHDKCMVYKLSN